MTGRLSSTSPGKLGQPERNPGYFSLPIRNNECNCGYFERFRMAMQTSSTQCTNMHQPRPKPLVVSMLMGTEPDKLDNVPETPGWPKKRRTFDIRELIIGLRNGS